VHSMTSLRILRNFLQSSFTEKQEPPKIDLEVIEALLGRKYSRGRGKFKGKVPLIYFSCEEIGHIAARCT
ncbi:hypothetical protein P3S38_27995, partial [Enterobacter hormaechei]|uniref:hypothetical protein n=1 Tax=Enterobacter hormaechei TaxID=158836 RepID=UPI0023E35803